MLIFMWTGSRFQFIWFHAIATRDVTIVEPFHRHRSQGNSLFKANLLLSLIGWTFILCFGTYFFYLAYGAGAFKPEFTWSAVFVLKLMAGPLIFLLIFVLAAIFINVMIEHFVVSVMALDKVSFLPAFRKVWGIFKTNKKDTALFYLLLFIMSVISVVIALIVTILGVIVVALAGVLVFGLGYLLFVTAMKAMPVFIIYCIVLGAPILAVAFLLIIFIRVPLAVFFRSYSIEFLYALNCGYSEESLENYEKDKSGERSKTFIWAPVLIIFLFIAVAFVGMLAAIAIPNFVKARDQARARAVATTQSSTANPGNSSSTIS